MQFDAIEPNRVHATTSCRRSEGQPARACRSGRSATTCPGTRSALRLKRCPRMRHRQTPISLSGLRERPLSARLRAIEEAVVTVSNGSRLPVHALRQRSFAFRRHVLREPIRVPMGCCQSDRSFATRSRDRRHSAIADIRRQASNVSVQSGGASQRMIDRFAAVAVRRCRGPNSLCLPSSGRQRRGPRDARRSAMRVAADAHVALGDQCHTVYGSLSAETGHLRPNDSTCGRKKIAPMKREASRAQSSFSACQAS
jgi:hypothetical protein